ncbi:hypothetical protein C0991_007183 [Blastosporella zonata]|nr:hypothetical protein C0991_007183 [Blastosporella zonata]
MNFFRSTRSGKAFSPFASAIPIYSVAGFDFPALLKDSSALELNEIPPEDGATGLDTPLFGGRPSRPPPFSEPCSPPLPAFACPLGPPAPPPSCFPVPLPAHSCPAGPSGLAPDSYPASSPQLAGFPPPSFRPPSSTPSSAAPALQSRDNARRARKRNAQKAAAGHVPKQRTHRLYMAPAAPVATDLDTESLPATRGAYAARPAKETPDAQTEWDLLRLLESGASLIRWPGLSVSFFFFYPRQTLKKICVCSEPRPLIDNAGRVVAVLLGRPRDPQYLQAAKDVYESFAREGSAAQFSTKQTQHRRGKYPALHIGVVHQQGTKEPVNLQVPKDYAHLVGRLRSDPALQRLASFASAMGTQYLSTLQDATGRLVSPQPQS